MSQKTTSLPSLSQGFIPFSPGLAAMAAIFCSFPAAQGALIASDSFNYGAAASTTSLSGLNGGTNWSGAYTALTGADVVDGSLSYTGGTININGGSRTAQSTINDNSSSLRRSFTAQTGTVYFSFLLRLNAGVMDDEFMQFFVNNGASSANGVSNGAIGDLAGAASVFGTRAANGSATTTVGSTTSYTVGTTYLLVGKVSKVSSTNYDTVDLFVNPTSITEPGSTAATSTRDTGLDTLSQFGLRMLNFDSDDRLQFDELKIGTTFASVVPEPGSALLLGTGLGILGLMRRRG